MRIDKQARGTKIETNPDYFNFLTSAEYQLRMLGFKRIELPTIYPLELYTDKAGKEIEGQMYTFDDKKGRRLCLAPEYTLPITEIAKDGVTRYLYYIQKCYRYERPQKGRYREFTQLGVEVLNGSKYTLVNLADIARSLTNLVTPDTQIDYSVKRGLHYYKGDGFEITCDKLGAQKQIAGGGAYDGGMGFAIGIDRLILCK